MTITNLVIYGLAVWRISSLFVNENGPGNIFLRLRELAGIIHDEEGKISIIPDGFFSGVLSCVWCCSIWVSFFLTVFWYFSPDWSLKLAAIPAISGIAIIIDIWVRR